MRILALETSTRCGGASIVQDGKVLAEVSSDRQRSHSELLNSFVDQCLQTSGLQLKDIDLFAVSRGPGSFTGIRVAGNTAKSYAYAFQKPLTALDSLYILAADAPDKTKPVLTILNAFKNMVYFAIYEVQDGQPQVLHPPQAAPISELLPLIQMPMSLVGDGIDLYREDLGSVSHLLHFSNQAPRFPKASTLGLLAEVEARNGRVLSWKDFRPLYLRASEAEEKVRGSLFKNAKDRVDGTGR